MMMPFMQQKPPPKEYLSPKWKAILRAVGFAASAIIIIQFGDLGEFPENPKFV